MDIYEKKYNEALERAREFQKSKDGLCVLTAESIFPELRESEDERIRKEIMEYLTVTREKDLVAHPERQRWIAYLEKQKEQKDYHKLYDDIAKSEWFKEAYEGKSLGYDDEQKEQKPLSTEETELNSIAFLEQMGYTCVPPGKEQKPIEWSEDWREEDIQTRFAFYTYKDNSSELYLSNVFVEEASRNHGFGTRILRAAEKVAETIGATTICLKVKMDSPANAWYRKNGYGYVTFEDGYDWLEKNLEYLKPKKEVEWSEEDEKIIQSLILKLNEYVFFAGIEVNKIVSFLTSLRPQPHKEIYQAAKHDLAIKFMNYLDENRPEGKMGLSNSECEDIDKAFKENDWAKIMRYVEKYSSQPKVELSEEDERLLNIIIDILDREEHNGHLMHGDLKACAKLLKSLRPDSYKNCNSRWKPSEEQMEALRHVIEYGSYDEMPLRLLYTNLKKLM